MKRIIYILIIVLTMVFVSNTAKSYEIFDGKYRYSEVGSGNKFTQTNLNEEVLFIVDFSSSMNKKLGYSPKIYLAIDAIRNILSNYGKEMKVGLRIFGVTDKPLTRYTPRGIEFIRENICTASKLILPIARYNSDNVSDRLSYISPQGATPIGYSLRQAVQNDFSMGDHLKHIILVTDGAENCGDDPCVFIRQLMQTRKDFKIDVIGITVDPNDYSKLSCISGNSGGHYYSINTPEDFKLKFEQALKSSQKPSITQLPQINALKALTGTRYKTYGFQFEY